MLLIRYVFQIKCMTELRGADFRNNQILFLTTLKLEYEDLVMQLFFSACLLCKGHVSEQKAKFLKPDLCHQSF